MGNPACGAPLSQETHQTPYTVKPKPKPKTHPHINTDQPRRNSRTVSREQGLGYDPWQTASTKVRAESGEQSESLIWDVHTHTHIYEYACIYIYIYVYINVCIYTYVFIYLYIHII